MHKIVGTEEDKVRVIQIQNQKIGTDLLAPNDLGITVSGLNMRNDRVFFIGLYGFSVVSGIEQALYKFLPLRDTDRPCGGRIVEKKRRFIRR